jgi:hypothetical protein
LYAAYNPENAVRGGANRAAQADAILRAFFQLTDKLRMEISGIEFTRASSWRQENLPYAINIFSY